MRSAPIAPAVAALCLCCLMPVPSPAATDRGPWTIDDVLTAEAAGEWTVSPDGGSAAWVRSTVETVDEEPRRVTNLWLTRLEGEGAPSSIQLTRGRGTVSTPAFSPDGRFLAFLSDRTVPGADEDEIGETQAWLLPLDGGEPYPATRFDRSVEELDWAGNASLLVLAREARAAWELESKRLRDTTKVVEDATREPPVRLFRVRLGEDRTPAAVERVTTNADWIDSLAVSPDGRWAVVRAQRSLSYDFDSRVTPAIRLLDLDTGGSRVLFTDRRVIPEDVTWQPDSGGFYVLDTRTSHPHYRVATVSELHHHDLETAETTPVDLGWERGVGGLRESVYAPVEGGLFVLLADGVRDRLAFYERRGRHFVHHDLAGGEDPPGTFDGTFDTLAASRDGRTILAQRAGAATPTQWFAASFDGERLGPWRQLTRLNPSFATKPTGRVEVVTWAGAGDDPIEGLLHYPLDYEPGRRYPLVLDIHGGPAGRDRHTWSQRWAAPTILWRQRGAFVLQPNYHGSTGYGLPFVESIGGGRYYDLELPDIEAGVDLAIERGLVDPERLALAGWSNGGILGIELLTRTDRYRAASIGAADVEWISDWGNVDFGASFDNYYFGAPPWEAPDLYIEKSPFFRLDRVTTPVLAFAATEDRNVPPHQAWSLFRALQQLDRAPVRLVLFPGEPHTLQKIPHHRRQVEEDLAWFERYLFETEEAPDPAVREGSLLAGLLGRARAARTGAAGAYGVEVDGVLVPELVELPVLPELRVGRFEVTRAQWAAFAPEEAPGPGEENLPVTGVGLERARDYVAWLAGHTGRPVRLPTAAEAERLAALARREDDDTAGNTLERWAGYAPNPDDAERIRRQLADRLGDGAAPLLLPVGSLGGVGREPVYDLDGNAAEWALDGEGGSGGRPVGPSAERAADGRAEPGEPAPEYVGLRVVEDR